MDSSFFYERERLANGTSLLSMASRALLLLLTSAVSSVDLMFDPTVPNCTTIYECASSACLSLGKDVSISNNVPINIRYHLYTNRNRNREIVIDPNSLLAPRRFDNNKHTFVLCHGWLDGSKFSLLMEMLKDALLFRMECNILVIDYSSYASREIYPVAAYRAKTIGKEVSKVIMKMKMNPSKVTLIGHSLGCMISGFIGQNIPGISVIIALDPAITCFKGLPDSERLNPSDADLVVSLYTNLGLDFNTQQSELPAQDTGHVEVFFNGGKAQPVCPMVDKVETTYNTSITHYALEIPSVCDHLIAIHYYRDCISKCRFIGVTCSNWKDFKAGKCSSCGKDGSRCVLLGPETVANMRSFKIKKRRHFYLYTSNHPPYCVHQYHVAIRFEVQDNVVKIGRLYLTLVGTTNKKTFNFSGPFPPISEFKRVVYCEDDLGNIQSVEIRWNTVPVMRVRVIAIRVTKLDLITVNQGYPTVTFQTGNDPMFVNHIRNRK